MMPTWRNLLQLRTSVALFAALCALGIGADAAALRFLQAEREANAHARQRGADIERRLRQANSEIADTHRRIRLYGELASRVLPPEQRAAWVQRIADAKREHGIVALRYRLSPRRPLAGHNADPEFMASSMTMDMRLRHEGDLLGFLAHLAEAPAILHVRSCGIARGMEHLDAQCMLDWVTLREHER